MTRQPRTAPLAVACAFAVLSATAANAQWITFNDETALRLPTDSGFTSDPDEKDLTAVDIDNDGDVDIIDVQKNAIYTPISGRSHRLLINNGSGVFTDQAATLAPGFLTNVSIARVPIVMDFDGDGWKDLVIVNSNDAGCTTNNQLQFYKNLGNNGSGVWLGLNYDTAGRFPQYNAPCARFCGGDGGDIDNDGDADLYLGDYNNSLEDKLLINDGNGFFTDQTAARIPGGTASTFTVDIYIQDINNDGWKDILISDGTVGLVKLRINAGAANPGNFPILNQPPNAATYTLAAGDLNNDGWLDLYQGRDGQDAYNLNLTTTPGANPTFSTISITNSPGTSGFAGNAQLVDMDNDGLRDLVMGDIDVDVPDCSRHATLLRNVYPASPLLMDPYSATSGCTPGSGGCQNFHMNGTHDIAVIDLNGDGRKDMIYALCTGYKAFIQNPPPFTISLTEPAPGGWNLSVDGAPPNYPIFNFASLLQLPAAAPGPFFGLDASAWTLWTALYPLPPTIGTTNGLGQYTYSFPAGTFVQTFPWTWQLRSAYLTGSSAVLSNIETRTF